jgi:hypothetical protein
MMKKEVENEIKNNLFHEILVVKMKKDRKKGKEYKKK